MGATKFANRVNGKVQQTTLTAGAAHKILGGTRVVAGGTEAPTVHASDPGYHPGRGENALVMGQPGAVKMTRNAVSNELRNAWGGGYGTSEWLILGAMALMTLYLQAAPYGK